jgi:hypothetical protein
MQSGYRRLIIVSLHTVLLYTGAHRHPCAWCCLCMVLLALGKHLHVFCQELPLEFDTQCGGQLSVVIQDAARLLMAGGPDARGHRS